MHHLAEHTDLAALNGPGAGADPTALAEWKEWARDQLSALGLSGNLRSARDPEAVTEMVAVAHTALTSEPARRAAALQHWAELPVAGTLTTVEGTTVAVDGVVDLVIDEPDGTLSIVDYKTDVSVTAATADEYLLQLCAYAQLLLETTDRKVSKVELVFCRGERPTVITRQLS